MTPGVDVSASPLCPARTYEVHDTPKGYTVGYSAPRGAWEVIATCALWKDAQMIADALSERQARDA